LVAAAFAGGGTSAPPAWAQPFPAPNRILILYAPAPDSPTAAPFIERLRLTMRTELAPPAEFYEEFLDFDRFPGPERRQQFARYFSDKYRGFKLDVVIAVGSAALGFATNELRPTLQNIPVVFGMTYAHRVDLTALPPNVTGRLINVSLGSTIRLARRLQPDAKRVVVIAGSSAIDSIAMAGALSDVGRLRDSVQLVLRQGWAYDALLADLEHPPQPSIVFIAHFRRDGRGQLFVPIEAITAMARDSRSPVYGYVDRMIGTGVVGGSMLVQDNEADETGRLAVRVLRRGPTDPIPPVQAPAPSLIVDWRELKRWNLDERRLPPGTEVLFRTTTLWERNRATILATIGVIVAESLLIGVLLLERRKRVGVQQTLEEQVAYEQTIAGITAAAARHATDDAPRALEDALGRLGQYAGADAAVLVQYPDLGSQSGARVSWSRRPAPEDGESGAPGSLTPDSGGHTRLELPLVVAGKHVARLELYRSRSAGGWPKHVATRLGPASQLIASAIARAAATHSADEAWRQVAHIGRVATMGELAATFSHELRQPLTAIRSNAEVGAKLLDHETPDLHEIKQVLQDIVADDIRASAVIDHIRLLLRNEPTEMTAVDLNEICRVSVLLLRRDRRSRGVTINLTLEANLPLVMGNAVELQQVVLNLGLNALDAVADVEGDRAVTVGTAARSDWVELFVKDTGYGLRPSVQQHLFESFYSTKAHGLGMGLVIVRSILERHHGRVSADNAVEGGAVFQAVLPRR
jgi:C4-dicarboxylate-specific signal transduction histidine kinase